MPVTAKLSQKFYDKFGEQVTNELVDWFNQVDATYKSDLRDLNEQNFLRFDAKVEQRMAESDARWERRLAELDTKWERRIAKLNAKWEQSLAGLNAKWEQHLADLETRWERRLSELNTKWEQHLSELNTKWEQRLGELNTKWEQRLGELDAKWEQRHSDLRLEVGRLDHRMESGFREIQSCVHADLAALDAKLTKRMFYFWAGTVFPLIGAMIALTR